MQADQDVQRRLITSYALMLDFYGFQVVEDDACDARGQHGGLPSIQVTRSPHYRERFDNLNTW